MVKLLDCTIRDGGHLNGWNFSDDCVRASYNSAVKSGVDYFEIGYRFQFPESSWGNFARCDDEYLFSLLNVNPNCKISVMVDAGKCGLEKFVECNLENTPISIVRVATYPDELEIAFDLCEGLKDKGYEVFLNFMAISDYSEDDFLKIKNWQNKSVLKSVYFADSFGSFVPDDVEKYYNILKEIGFYNISFHSHNNLQLAFANSLKAIELGCYCIDCSIFGMGRGAGNLPSELITGYLNKTFGSKYNPVPYLDIISEYYLSLVQKTSWGYHVQSLISGLKNIHPYYVDALFEKNRNMNEVWNISEKIKNNAPISYDVEVLNKVL